MPSRYLPDVYVFPVQDLKDEERVQNIMLVAVKKLQNLELRSADQEIDEYLQHLWAGTVTNGLPPLTDDYAPVDYYTAKTILLGK